ncbi:MAG: WavE lipopolysaccharide synthesis family protein [Roseinatronobacter sp.]
MTSATPKPPLRPDGASQLSLRSRLLRRLQRWIVAQENVNGGDYTTLHHRPKRAAQIKSWPHPALVPPRSAVVMQGPPFAQDDFTLETLRLYARNMPGAQLILSTWHDTDPSVLRAAQDLGVTVVLSDKPEFPGLFNINMQLVSAGAGVRRAVADGAEWVLKTRTDQRLHAPDALPSLVALAQAFPVVPGTAQRHRIVGIGHGSLKYAPYHVTDQTVFGHADDMLAYWTPPLRTERAPEHWPGDLHAIFTTTPIGELCRLGAAESHIASRFLIRMGRPLDWTLVDSWAAYRDHFIFADHAMTDFFWVKAQQHTQRELTVGYDMISNRQEMGFSDWLLLHGGHLPPEAAAPHAKVLEQCFNMAVPRP